MKAIIFMGLMIVATPAEASEHETMIVTIEDPTEVLAPIIMEIPVQVLEESGDSSKLDHLDLTQTSAGW